MSQMRFPIIPKRLSILKQQKSYMRLLNAQDQEEERGVDFLIGRAEVY